MFVQIAKAHALRAGFGDLLGCEGEGVKSFGLGGAAGFGSAFLRLAAAGGRAQGGEEGATVGLAAGHFGYFSSKVSAVDRYVIESCRCSGGEFGCLVGDCTD